MNPCDFTEKTLAHYEPEHARRIRERLEAGKSVYLDGPYCNEDNGDP